MIDLSTGESVRTIRLHSGKVNALNEDLIAELKGQLEASARDAEVKAVILTGHGAFFSFGFDVPEFLSYSKDDFGRFVRTFTGLYRYMFLFPKPIIAALNGHAIAGAFMLASACDYRLMVRDKGKLSLNEITFGSTLFAGSLEILKYVVGPRIAEKIAISGDMFSAEEGLHLGFIDELCDRDRFESVARQRALEFAAKDPVAFRSIKRQLRGPVADAIDRREPQSIDELTDIWYSEGTRKKLREIVIRDSAAPR